MRNKKESIINELIISFPMLKKDISDIINDFQEIYLHLIFGDVFNPFLIGLLDDCKSNHMLLKKAGNLLENMLTLDEEIQEVVVVTVLERLSDDKQKFLNFFQYAGKNTKKHINQINKTG